MNEGGVPFSADIAAIVATTIAVRSNSPIGVRIAINPGAVADRFPRLALQGKALLTIVIKDKYILIVRPDRIRIGGLEVQVNRIRV